MKNRYLFKVGFACALLCASVVYTSCGDDDDPTPSNQNTSGTQNPTGGDENPSGGNNNQQTGGNENQQTGGNENENPNKPVDEVTLVSELKCTVAEFATKYTTLKKGEKVTVTLTDVSDANIAKVSETLKKMSADPISKAGEAKYIVSLILESISNALKTIPADTFKGVEVLREVVIPACVEAIQSDAFAECVNLVSAKILGADTKVDEKAFESANEEIKVEQTQKEVVTPSDPEKPEVVEPSSFLDANGCVKTADVEAYLNAVGEEEVTLKVALEGYDEEQLRSALIRKDKKVELVFPVGVTQIGINDFAFMNCDGIASIIIPQGCKDIGFGAFNGCFGLKGISLPYGLTEIVGRAFSFCYMIDTPVVIPQGVIKIGDEAFYSCNQIPSISIPDGVVEIGDKAFGFCESLNSITIPESVTEIGDGAFAGCYELETIYCSQAIYDKYHVEYPQMVVKGGVSGNVSVDNLVIDKDIK